MSSIEFTFTKPLYLLLVIPALLIILLPFFRLPKQRRNHFRKIAPVILHIVVVCLLVLILSGFTVAKQTYEKAVMILVDLSSSTRPVQKEIESRTQQLLELVDAETPVGIVAFGQDQVYALHLESDRTYTAAKVGTDATDISGALQYTASLLPADRAGHIILFSDGKQTDTDANDTAAQLASKGIRIDAVYFDTNLTTKEVQISSLRAPDGAYVGDTMTFTADIVSNTDADITLSFYDGPKLLQRVKQSIPSGNTVVEFSCEAESTGVHDYQLVLDTRTDTLKKNNECYAYVNIAGEPSVLIIADTLANAETLAAVLEEENSVTAVTVWNAPQTITKLCNYDEVILSNADFSTLPHGYDALLATYVSVYGRSLLAIGGEETFMYGGMSDTKLEEMLPVELTLEEEDNADPVAMMLVLDCSASMEQRGANLTVAKQGAIKCIEAMSGNDYVGVVTFSGFALLESSLIQATPSNKDQLSKTISGLVTNRGTYYREALTLAYEQLVNSNAKTRHIIFLSDGRPSDWGYMEVVQQAAKEGITVSTVGLGYASTILQDMADDGNGRYYYVQQATQLPNIMLTETKHITVDSLITGDFKPVVVRHSALTETLENPQLPHLYGYLGTTLKEDATAYITTEKGHPIYAQWSYGKGTVGCFTSDLNGNWSSKWLADPTGTAVTRNMVSATVDLLSRGSSLSVQVTPKTHTTDITVTTADTTPSTLTLAAEFAGNTNTYTLTATEPGVYTTSINTRKAGVYELLITQADLTETIVDYSALALTVSYPKEYDAFAQGGQELLSRLCGYSGGQLHTDLQPLANLPVSAVNSYYSPMGIFAAIAAILMLTDIAIRKLRWKDVCNYLSALNHK